MSHSPSFLDLQSLCQQDLPNICYNSAGQLILTATTQSEITSTLRQPSLQEKAHLRLAFYWLKLYQPDENASNLEKVRGYIEAFYHFCQLSAWSVAWQVLQLPVVTGKQFYEQFQQWGYYREQVEIYPALLGKLDRETDCTLCDYLGYAYYNLGQAQNALNSYQQQLELARQIKSLEFEALALHGIGLTLGQIGFYKDAIAHHQEELQIAKSLDDSVAIARSLRGLGISYFRDQRYQQSIVYLKQALALAEKSSDLMLSNLILINLGENHVLLGKPKLAADYLESALIFFREINASYEICQILQPLSNAYLLQGEIHESFDLLEKALELSERKKYYQIFALALNNIGIRHAYYFKNYDEAILSFQKCISYYKSINSQQRLSVMFSNLSYCYGCLKQTPKAIRYAKKAIALARKSQSEENEGIGVAMLGNAYWHDNRRILGLLLAIRAAIMLPPWHSANGKLLLKKTIDTVFNFPKMLFAKLLSCFTSLV